MREQLQELVARLTALNESGNVRPDGERELGGIRVTAQQLLDLATEPAPVDPVEDRLAELSDRVNLLADRFDRVSDLVDQLAGLAGDLQNAVGREGTLAAKIEQLIQLANQAGAATGA